MKKMILLSPIILGLIIIEIANYVGTNELYHLLLVYLLSPIFLFSASHEYNSKQIEMHNMGKFFFCISVSAMPSVITTELIPLLTQEINLLFISFTAITYLFFLLMVIAYFRKRHQRINSELLRTLF